MTAPESPVGAVECAASTGTKPRPVAVWALGGPCTVCGHTADMPVVFPKHREVRHVSGWRPCVLPNPPSRKDGAS